MAFLAALAFYVLRSHLLVGLSLGIVVCLLGIVAISLLERRRSSRTGQPPDADGGQRADLPKPIASLPLVERTEYSKTTEEGTVTAWEETRRGQDVTVTPPTVAAKAEVPTPHIDVGITELKIPGPANFSAIHLVQFTTANRSEHHEDTRRRPKALRFLFPMQATVREADLPMDLPCGGGKLIIKRFTDQGFSFEEKETGGDEVRAEVYFSEEPA